MIATPNNVSFLGDDLDHPECVCVGPDGTVYAGGEEGQLYRIIPGGAPEQFGRIEGEILGLALDGQGRLHVCNVGRSRVVRVDPDGSSVVRSTGTAARPMEKPNYAVFDARGNLYVSDTGDYWSETGTGVIYVIRPDDTTEVFHHGPFRAANGLAIHPSGEWLYIAQSSAWNVVRVPLSEPDGAIAVTNALPAHTVPDGLAFTAQGRLVIACYRPDIVCLGYPDGRLQVLVEDLTGELLLRPTNVALHDGKMYLANLGGRCISVLDTDLEPGPLHRPRLP
jgi:gluconolactonase